MYYVTIPDPVQLINKATGKPVASAGSPDTPEQPFTLYRYVVTFVTPDPAWAGGDKGRKPLRAASKFEDALENAQPGDVVAIEDDWHARARRAIEEPEGKGPTAIMPQLIPLMDAICDASESPPEADSA